MATTQISPRFFLRDFASLLWMHELDLDTHAFREENLVILDVRRRFTSRNETLV